MVLNKTGYTYEQNRGVSRSGGLPQGGGVDKMGWSVELAPYLNALVEPIPMLQNIYIYIYVWGGT